MTLGVTDLAKARAFYGGIGFKASAASNDQIEFYDAGGVVLALFSRAALAKDVNRDDSPQGFSGVTLAHNVGSEAEVEAVLHRVVAAGATLVKPAHRAFWGGYSGYFADPDGHLWEVAHNPFIALDEAGRLVLPPSPS